MPIFNPPTVPRIATGTYTGNAADGRQITTGFKCSMVVIITFATLNGRISRIWVAIPNITKVEAQDTGGTGEVSLHATNGFVVNALYSNANLITYYYWAIEAL